LWLHEDEMHRRRFIALLGSAIAPLCVAAAQQKAMPVIGFLGANSPGLNSSNIAAFHQGLSETGYVEGQNVAIEYRWGEGQYDRLPALAADLVARKVNVILAGGGIHAAQAAKGGTSTIPIIFSVGRSGLDRLGRESGPARRQPHRRQHHGTRDDAQAARAAVRAGSPGRCDCPTCEPEKPADRAHHSRHA
jgi:hypothetical protein